MKIRDSFSRINGIDTVLEMPSGGLDILGEDNRVMFSISLKDDTLYIDGGDTCKLNGKMLDSKFVIKPKAANCVELVKIEYK